VIFGLYAKLHSPSTDPVSGVGKAANEIQRPLTEPATSDHQPSEKGVADSSSPRKTNRILPEAADTKKTPPDSKPQAPIPAKSPSTDPVPEPAKPVSSQVVETPPSAPAANLSSLSAQLVSLVRREEGGLQATVRFKNNSDRPMSVLLDTQQSILGNDQGRGDSIVGSSLPGDASLHLDLAAGASSSQTFDFPVPKLHSKVFNLALLTADGQNIKVTDRSKTLEGPP
jgi:hypothetical protein